MVGLRNKMSGSVLEDILTTFIERDMFFNLNENDILATSMAIRSIISVQASFDTNLYSNLDLEIFIRYFINYCGLVVFKSFTLDHSNFKF